MTLEDKLKVGDIILVKGKSWISKTIQFATDSEYSHSACYIGHGMIVESDWQGVQIHILNRKYRYHSYSVFRHKTAKEDQLINAVYWMLDQDGKGYDYYGLMGIGYSLITRNKKNCWDDKDKFWCQELIMDGYMREQIPVMSDPHSWLSAPADTSRDVNFKKVLEVLITNDKS